MMSFPFIPRAGTMNHLPLIATSMFFCVACISQLFPVSCVCGVAGRSEYDVFNRDIFLNQFNSSPAPWAEKQLR
jgi:hypothetical protein